MINDELKSIESNLLEQGLDGNEFLEALDRATRKAGYYYDCDAPCECRQIIGYGPRGGHHYFCRLRKNYIAERQGHLAAQPLDTEEPIRIYDAAKIEADRHPTFSSFAAAMRRRELGLSEEDIRHAWDLLTEEHGSQGREHSVENPLAL